MHIAMNAQELRSLYDHGYFHGVNSGYPAEGYAQFHPVWNHWIEFVLDVRPGASRWLDIGCAFGYLILEGRSKGLQVFGCDVSSYALDQAADARRYLVESLAESMPFADCSFDIISVFDVLEQIHSPELADKLIPSPGLPVNFLVNAKGVRTGLYGFWADAVGLQRVLKDLDAATK